MGLKFLCVRTKVVILLEIVVARPETHLVKNHESLSIEPMSPSSDKQGVLRPLCNQNINLEVDAKTLYYSLLKLK